MNDEKIIYSKEKIESVRLQVLNMIRIVNELEADFPGRHFTLDGHLIGSIGEVMAVYHYGISLYEASAETHDGEVNGKKVQIKMTQQDNVILSSEPDYLIVLYLNKNGNVYEVYNGPGKEPWKLAGIRKNHSGRCCRVNKLMEIDKEVPAESRIRAIYPIEKLKKEYKNRSCSETK